MIRERAARALTDVLLWVFWVPFRRSVQLLPLRVAYLAASGAAWMGSWVLLGLLQKIAGELAELLGQQRSPKELRRIARESIRLEILRRFEDLFLGRFDKESIVKAVSLEGEEFLHQAIGQGKGTLILLSHFGSFLMILPALAFRGHRISQLAGPPELSHHRKINRLIFSVREKDYARLPIKFLRSDLNVKTAFRALADNELVAMALDGRISSSWIRVSFFGRPAWFAPGPIKIARRTGAAILPTFIVRDRDCHHRLIFAEPIRLDPSVPEDELLQVHTQRLVAALEQKITEHPAHFAMILHINRKRSRLGIEKSIFA